MHRQFLQPCLALALLCALVSAREPACADQTEKSATATKNTTRTKTESPKKGAASKTNATVLKSAPIANSISAAKAAPAVKGAAAPCVTLVKDTSGFYQYAYWRGKNGCARRIRLWVFHAENKKWYDSIIIEPKEDATAAAYDGLPVGPSEIVAACYMSGDSTPAGCFSAVAGGLYPIASNSVKLR
jgi:hypothetical protein